MARPRRNSASRLRPISEVCEILGLEAHVLRFWETKFDDVKPVKRGGGRRYYRPEHVALLAGLKTLLHEEGQSIRAVQEQIARDGAESIARAVDTDAATAEPPAQSPAPKVDTAPQAPSPETPGPAAIFMPRRILAPAQPDPARGTPPHHLAGLVTTPQAAATSQDTAAPEQLDLLHRVTPASSTEALPQDPTDQSPPARPRASDRLRRRQTARNSAQTAAVLTRLAALRDRMDRRAHISLR